VSHDRSEKEFKEYVEASHPWWAVDYSDRKAIEHLVSTHGIQGIPALHKVDVNNGNIEKDWRGKTNQLNSLN